MKLKLIGYWTEQESDWAFPDPKDLVDPDWHPDLREKVTEYLVNGSVFSNYWGYSHCRFEGGPPETEMGSKDLTDGVFVWPQGLPVYVSRYQVVLPEEFVDHMRAHDFKVPEHPRIVREKFLSAMTSSGKPSNPPIIGAEVDYEYWTSWAAGYLSAKAAKEGHCSQ